ncbi:hypothetical protein MMC25_005310 [Agyrium rufum]|nr:hypothetical protein [Agyrium rufum]
MDRMGSTSVDHRISGDPEFWVSILTGARVPIDSAVDKARYRDSYPLPPREAENEQKHIDEYRASALGKFEERSGRRIADAYTVAGLDDNSVIVTVMDWPADPPPFRQILGFASCTPPPPPPRQPWLSPTAAEKEAIQQRKKEAQA